MSRLTAIVVTYNSQDTIIACLTSLKEYLPEESKIVVVDNSSSDKTVDLVRQFVSEMGLNNFVLYSLSENLGFGAGNNYAMKRHPSEYYYLHNGDAYLQSKTTLQDALDLFAKEQNIGIIGLPLVFPDGSVQNAAYSFMSMRKMGLQVLHVHTLARALINIPSLEIVLRPLSRFSIARSFIDQQLGREDNCTHQYYDWVCGAALLLHESVYQATGGFDERIFLYGEDELLAYRSQEKGFKTAQVHTDAVIHDFGWGKHKKKNSVVQKLKYEGLSHVINCYYPQSDSYSRVKRKLMKLLTKYHIRMGVT